MLKRDITAILLFFFFDNLDQYGMTGQNPEWTGR